MSIPAWAVKLFQKCVFRDTEGYRDGVGISASLCDPSQVRQEVRPNFAFVGLNISALTRFLPLPPKKQPPPGKTTPGPNPFGQPTCPAVLSFHSHVHQTASGVALPGPGYGRAKRPVPSGTHPGSPKK